MLIDDKNNNNNLNDGILDNENIDINKFSEGLMDELSENERLGVMYFAGIKALKEKIEDNSKLLYKLALLEEDNVIFSTLFFMFVILTGNNAEVKNTILKCKQEEFDEKNVSSDKVNGYIDIFNSRMKVLAQKYMDINAKVKGDEEFQKTIINEFSTYLMDELKIEKTTDAYKELEQIFLYALKIAFGFKDAENKVATEKQENKE